MFVHDGRSIDWGLAAREDEEERMDITCIGWLDIAHIGGAVVPFSSMRIAPPPKQKRTKLASTSTPVSRDGRVCARVMYPRSAFIIGECYVQ